MPMTRASGYTPRQVDHKERRQRIAEGVCKIAASRGLEAVTIREIAAEARTSIGQIQHHFATKDELAVSATALLRELIGQHVRPHRGGGARAQRLTRYGPSSLGSSPSIARPDAPADTLLLHGQRTALRHGTHPGSGRRPQGHPRSCRSIAASPHIDPRRPGGAVAQGNARDIRPVRREGQRPDPDLHRRSIP
ncbi:TetR family transcriptional regulator [Streptomyces sp900116325]|uniref:TetR family transcriptional regulator n=1 Tax=Streptomyces sp. 900116325 TaxID=3154295 RepID=UPI0033E473A5